MSRHNDLNRFYSLLQELKARQGGYRYLKDCTAATGWPDKGVYFFFERGEVRDDGNTPRVVRVGTHAVSAGAGTTLWGRLRTHRGQRDGRGNHRGSIFRLRVGEALLNSGNYPSTIHKTWAQGQSAGHNVTEPEQVLEKAVSEYIGRMPLLFLDVDDEPGPGSRRAYIERNAIALLSNFAKPPIDAPSESWLGFRSTQETIRQSGLWNTNHIAEQYAPEFLDVLKSYIYPESGSADLVDTFISNDDWNEMVEGLRDIGGPAHTNTLTTIPVADVHEMPFLVPPKDEVLMYLMSRAYEGHLPVFRARVPMKAVRPFSSEYDPRLHHIGRQVVDSCKGDWDVSAPSLLVYPDGEKFVMSDDYMKFYAAKERKLEYVDCIVLGSFRHVAVRDVVGPLSSGEIKKSLGIPE